MAFQAEASNLVPGDTNGRWDVFVHDRGDPSLLPQPPMNLVATSIVGNRVTITWTPPATGPVPTDYVLEGGINPGDVLASIPIGSTTPTFTFVAPTGAFYIRVHTIAGASRSGPSNEIRIVVNLPSPPSAPTNLLGLVNGSTLYLSWTNAVVGATPTSLVLEVAGAVVASLSLPVSESFSYAGVPNGTYTFRLRATNANGVSPPSPAITLTFPRTCLGVPAVPTAFAASKNGNTITVSWAPPVTGAAVTGYTLIVTGSFVGSFPTTGRSLAGTVGAGSYTLSVRAENPCGSGAATSTQTVVIP